MSTTYKNAPQAVAPSPPIVELVHLVGHLLSVSYGLVTRTTVALVLSLLAPLSLLYAPIAYLLSPVFVLSRVLVDVFVLTPYYLIVSIARNVYPVYVFVGSAFICAVLLGFLARMLSTGLKRYMFPSRYAVQQHELQDTAPPAPVEPEKSAMKSYASNPKTRLRKRVSIRDERER